MSNIHNFANRQLCEYTSIFPTVASLLDHLLFTNGNGYSFRNGMIVDSNNVRIDEYPEMTDAEWDKLLAACYSKERIFAQEYSSGRPINEVELAEDCAKYQRVSVSDADFSIPSLLADLLVMEETYQETYKLRDQDHFLRPYPLSKGYAEIYRLNEKTPKWFLQIGFNICAVWTQYLTKEIETGHVWLPPSQRPKVEPTAEQIAQAEGMKSLFDMLKADKDYDGWLDKPEPTSDYGDLHWTTVVRDQLAAQAERIGVLLNGQV